MASLNQRDLVKVGYIGKVKTTVQMIAITILIGVDAQTPSLLSTLGQWLIYLSAVFSLWSMISYLRAAIPTLKMK
jgi:CDP-diacylglycerol--glycerol-3-phosphate 3-phosphatidyltransferase